MLNVAFPLLLLPLVVGVLWSGRLADEPFTPWATLAGGSAGVLAVLMLAGWWTDRRLTPSIPAAWARLLENTMLSAGIVGYVGLEALLTLCVAHTIH